MSDNIKRFYATTKAGNTLSFFYNPDNDLVVIDLTHKNESGGRELLRQTLREDQLLQHCTTKARKKERQKKLERAIKALDTNDTTFIDDYFSREEWQQDVAAGDTKLGYISWVIHNLETME